MSQLQDNLNEILRQKNEYLLPANLRAGVTLLGVEGNMQADKPDQTKNVTPTTSAQQVIADTGYELAAVNVAPVTSTIDANIVAGNIKNGVSILGVQGNYNGTSPYKVFNDVTSMNNSTGNVKGDIALVYSLEPITDASSGVTANCVLLPDEFEFDWSTVTETPIQGLSSTDDYIVGIESTWGTDLYVTAEVTSGGWEGARRLLYNKVSGTNRYTRAQNCSTFWFMQDDVVYGGPQTKIKILSNVANIFKAYNYQFNGVYYYDGTNWVVIPNQLTATAQTVLSGITAYSKSGIMTGSMDLSASKDIVILPAYSCSALRATETAINPSGVLVINKANFPVIGDKRWAIFSHKDNMREYWDHILVVFNDAEGYYQKVIGVGNYRYEPNGTRTCYGNQPVGDVDPVDFLCRTNTINNINSLITIPSTEMQIFDNYQICIGVFDDGLVATNCDIKAYNGDIIIQGGPKAANVLTGTYYINAFGEKVVGTYTPPSMSQAEINTAVDTTENILGEPEIPETPDPADAGGEG